VVFLEIHGEGGMFFHLDLDQAVTQSRGINDGYADHSQQKRDAANVVFMAVTNDQCFDLRLVFDEIRVIGNYVIDTQ